MKKYRYPGAQPFTQEQKDLFFGRKEDTEKTIQLIKLEKLVVIYSKSGLGKSSLINAGIIPTIKEEEDYKPLVIRFGAYTKDKNQAPATISRLRITPKRNKFYLDKLLKKEFSLWSAVKYQQLQGSDKIILFFDQFEELFTYPNKTINQFCRQLAELLNNQIPQRYRNALEQQFKEKNVQLTDQELDHLHEPFEVKIVFAIRSDRLSLLNQLKKYLPNVLRNCYELTPLNRNQAEEAIFNPAYKKGKEYISGPFDYEDAAIERILDYLTDKENDQIESFQLQILCQSIERKVIYHSLKLITLDDIGNLDNVYKNYYENQIMLIGTPEEQLASRLLIEEGLIFEEEKRRLSLYEGQIRKNFDVSEELLRKLVDSHIIRAEPSMQGGYTYELSHDTLVAPVLKSKTKRKEEERKKREAQIRKEIEAQKRAEEAERRRLALERKRRLQFNIFLGVVISLTIITSLAWNLVTVAKKNRELEEAKQDIEQLFEEQQKLTMDRAVANYKNSILRGDSYAKEKNFKDAIASYQAAIAEVVGLDLKKDSIFAANKIKAIEQKLEAENDFNNLIEEGDQLLAKNSFSKAKEKYLQAQALNYDEKIAKDKLKNLESSIDRIAEDYIRRARNFLKQGYKGFAVDWIKKAAVLRPNHPELEVLRQQAQ